MRAMLDQLMGTSRDGKSLPVPWGWGRGWRRGSAGAPGLACVTGVRGSQIGNTRSRLRSHPIRAGQAGWGGGVRADWRELLPMVLDGAWKPKGEFEHSVLSWLRRGKPTSLLHSRPVVWSN